MESPGHNELTNEEINTEMDRLWEQYGRNHFTTLKDYQAYMNAKVLNLGNRIPIDLIREGQAEFVEDEFKRWEQGMVS